MQVRFLRSCEKDFPPEDLREVVFVGRSNVGKSSLINMIAGRSIARVSKEPGRTRMINYFVLDEKVYLVDVPGYGFARVPPRERQKWKRMMENYFSKREGNIKILFLLIDSKVGPQRLDQEMIEWIRWMGVPYAVVLTKVDKARQKDLGKTISKLKELSPEARIILTSAREGKGKREILSMIL